MEQESSIQREHQLGYNLEANSLALLPPSNAAAGHHHATIAGHDILQFYPPSHYLAASGNPYGHFSAGSTFQSYYPQAAQAAPEYYFPTLVSSAEENMASFAATQLGLNLGYRTYFPPEGGTPTATTRRDARLRAARPISPAPSATTAGTRCASITPRRRSSSLPEACIRGSASSAADSICWMSSTTRRKAVGSA